MKRGIDNRARTYNVRVLRNAFYLLIMQIVQCIQTVHTKDKRKKTKYQGGILWLK